MADQERAGEHKDVVRNNFGDLRQERVARLTPDDEDQGYPEGGYSFTTEVHTDENCPFRDGPWLPMVFRSVAEVVAEGRRIAEEMGLTDG